MVTSRKRIYNEKVNEWIHDNNNNEGNNQTYLTTTSRQLQLEDEWLPVWRRRVGRRAERVVQDRVLEQFAASQAFGRAAHRHNRHLFVDDLWARGARQVLQADQIDLFARAVAVAAVDCRAQHVRWADGERHRLIVVVVVVRVSHGADEKVVVFVERRDGERRATDGRGAVKRGVAANADRTARGKQRCLDFDFVVATVPLAVELARRTDRLKVDEAAVDRVLAHLRRDGERRHVEAVVVDGRGRQRKRRARRRCHCKVHLQYHICARV